MWAEIRLSPAAQLGPPQITAVALPSLSSVTGKLGPVTALYGYGSDQLRWCWQRL